MSTDYYYGCMSCGHVHESENSAEGGFCPKCKSDDFIELDDLVEYEGKVWRVTGKVNGNEMEINSGLTDFMVSPSKLIFRGRLEV